VLAVLVNAAASDGLAARSLAQDQAEIGYELAREAANFSDQHHGCDQAIPTLPARRQQLGVWVVLRQKTFKMLTRSGHDLSDDTTHTDQITRGFVIGVRPLMGVKSPAR
jgi:hypothetical protein